MKILPTLFVAILTFAASVQAEAPFTWPESYSITYKQTGWGDPITNTYTVDGLKARNEAIDKNGQLTITIFQLAEKKMISVSSNGFVNETILPASMPLTPTPPFPTSGAWEIMSNEVVNGKEAIKYKVTNNPAKPAKIFYVWLAKNDNAPLRMISDPEVREIITYHTGPQDPALFEAPKAKTAPQTGH
jgi:hypothetical protein